MSKLDSEVRIVMDIFNDAWMDNWCFVPFTENEIVKLAADLKMIAIPALSYITEVDGEPAAVAVALPNVNELIKDMHGSLFPLGLPKLLWRLKVVGPKTARLAILGIKKKFRTQRKYAALSAYLYTKMNRTGRDLGIQWGELSWTVEDNGPVNVASSSWAARSTSATASTSESSERNGQTKMTILVTGATGFLGSHVAEQLAQQGERVRALVRSTSDTRFLKSLSGVELVHGSVEDRKSVLAAAEGVTGIVHAAGLVKAKSAEDFMRTNCGGTENLLEAAVAHRDTVKRFVLVSSLAALRPSDGSGSPVAEDVEPRPVTDYGRSKLAAERAAFGKKDSVSVVVMRPPAIYGPS
jgi:putative NADH-flavin reductase